MTQVGLKLEGAVLNMRVSGHAEREENEDTNLCCAGISMLVQTATELAQRYEVKGYVSEMTIENESGHSTLYLKMGSHKDKIEAMYEFLTAGFDLLTARFPGKIAWGEI